MEKCFCLISFLSLLPASGVGGLCLFLVFAPLDRLVRLPNTGRMDHFLSKAQDNSLVSDYNPNRNPYISQFVQHSVQRTGG
jgi:hypothetical protein